MKDENRVIVALDGSYQSGHTVERQVNVRVPAGNETELIEQWWDEAVFPETGDGRPHEESHWEATVLWAPEEFKNLIGQKREWAG